MRIMIVDDKEENRRAISSVVTRHTDHDVVILDSGTKALNIIKNKEESLPDLILLDIVMPDVDGYAVAEELKKNPETETIPIIFITGLSSLPDKIKAFEKGCVDFIAKPFKKEELLARINTHLKLKSLYDELKTKNKIIEETDHILKEKNLLLETNLDILSHDTKNIFLNINLLLEQQKKDPLRNMIKENINELFELTMEAVGYQKTKKRIYFLLELLQKIRLTKERVLLPEFPRIKLSYTDDSLLFVETSALLKNAISNLIENAIKYSPANMEIEVKLERKKDKIFVHVADRGPGIPDEQKKKIFDRYYRLEQTKQIEGTGRGLWITHNIINNEGGKLEIKDNPKGGAVFTIELPAFKINNLGKGFKQLSDWFNMPIDRVKKKAEVIKTIVLLNNHDDVKDTDSVIFANLLALLRKESRDENHTLIQTNLKKLKSKNPNGKKVVIVDDSIYVHYYLARSLTNLGFCIVDFAKNGKDGIALYKNYNPDLICLDNTMPLMSGLEASKQIYSYDNNVKILFLSAVADSTFFISSIKAFLPEKNYRALIKPTKDEEIKSALTGFVEP